MSIGFSVEIHFHDNDSKHGQKINEDFIRLKKERAGLVGAPILKKAKLKNGRNIFCS